MKAGEESLVMIYGGKVSVTRDRLRFGNFYQKLASPTTSI